MLLRDKIYQIIRNAILSGELYPGQELREQDLATRHKVSRSPIRDALLRLEQENLVIVLPRQGYLIKPISPLEIEQIFGLRLLLEPNCAAAAAAQASEADLKLLDRFRDVAHVTTVENVAFDISFHHAIVELSSNQRLAEMVGGLIDQVERLALVALRNLDEETVGGALAENQPLIDALQHREADRALQLCRALIEKAHHRIGVALPFTQH